MPRPNLKEVPQYYVPYINRVEEDNIVDAFVNSEALFEKLVSKIPEDKANFRFEKDKWSIKEVVQHITDSERIFNYRALCIARGEMQALPGYDQNYYAENSNCDKREWESILSEFRSLRASSIDLFRSFDSNALNRLGNANGLVLSVNATGFITVGHLIHHLQIIQERYL